MSPALQADSLSSELPVKPICTKGYSNSVDTQVDVFLGYKQIHRERRGVSTLMTVCHPG